MNLGLDKIDKGLGITQKLFWILITLGGMILGAYGTGIMVKFQAAKADEQAAENKNNLIKIMPVVDRNKTRSEENKEKAEQVQGNVSNIKTNQVLIQKDIEEVKDDIANIRVDLKKQSELSQRQLEILLRLEVQNNNGRD